MKKVITTAMAAIMFFAIALIPATIMSGCERDPRLIRLSEVTRSVFYAPLYVAMHNGYFDEADIRIELTNAGGANHVMTALITGAADVGLMGPEATV